MFGKQRLIIKQWLNQYDPGLLHSRHACRTVLSVLITALLLRQASASAMFLACFASGSVQQGLVGYRRQDIMLSMAISSIAMLAYACVSMLLQSPPWLSNLGLITGAFFAFYVRRFGQRYHLFPIFVWLIGFVTTIFIKTFSWTLMLHTMLAIATGLVVAMAIRYWLIPDIRAQQFANTIHAFFAEIRQALAKINQQLKHLESPHMLNSYLPNLKTRLRHLFVQNEAILTLSYGRNNFCEQQLFRYLNNQYNAGKSLIMVIQSLDELLEMPSAKYLHTPSCLHELMQKTRHNMTYLCRSLHPVIQYKDTFSIHIVLHQQLDLMSNLDEYMKRQYTHFDDMTIAVFKYQFNLQHLIHNLTAFSQHDQ